MKKTNTLELFRQLSFMWWLLNSMEGKDEIKKNIAETLDKMFAIVEEEIKKL